MTALHTSDDASRLRRRLVAGPRRVLVIGGGFIGSEVASNCREMGLAVTVVEHRTAPLAAALGGVIGAVAADLQRDHGVDLRCGVKVTHLEGDAGGRLRRAHLSDGSTLDVDVAVAVLGAVRDVEWLREAGLAATSRGVVCDASCRVFEINGIVCDDVFVAGDVGCFPHPLYGYRFLSIEHWGNAVDQSQIAAHNMVLRPERPLGAPGHAGVLVVAVRHEHQGRRGPRVRRRGLLAQGSIAARRFVAVYGQAGGTVAAVGFDEAKWLDFYARMINAAAPFPPAFRTVDQPNGTDDQRLRRGPRSGQPSQPLSSLRRAAEHAPSARG